MPIDYPRSVAWAFRGARLPFELPTQLTKALQSLSQREGVTLFILLLAALQTLLYRYTGQNDVVVGTPIANRSQLEINSLLGFFLNTLVLRTDISGEFTFRGLLRQVQEAVLEANAYQNLPLEKRMEELASEAKPSHSPLVQVIFLLQQAPEMTLASANVSKHSLEQDGGVTTSFDLKLSMLDTQPTLLGTVEYNAELFDITTITRLVRHFQTLLQGIVAHPEQRLAELPILTEAERRQILIEWNTTQTDYPKDKCIHQLIEAKVEQAPGAIALICEDKRPTYQQINRQANQLAYYLQQQGVAPEVRIGICVERTQDLVIGLLGILKAGGAYVPLDPAYPQERLAFMLEDAQVSILLTHEQFLARLPKAGPHTLCLDADWEEIAKGSEENQTSSVMASNLAYIIYTSGSTGKPKGIAIKHQGVVNNIVDLNRRFGIDARDRVLALSSLSFDMCVYEVLGILVAGGAVVMPEISKGRDPGHWAELMNRYQVSLWNSAPSLLTVFVEHIADHPHMRPRFLRLVLLGGDWIPVSLPDQLKTFAGEDVQVISLGGATEASIHSVIYPIEKCASTWKSIPYGRPMANQQAYLLDAFLQLVPIGVPGELHLGGVGLARGYFNGPERSAEKFIPHPFSQEGGARLYKTGDLARYLPDGNIELLGRMDYQVKINGLRIELGEIETALRRHAAIQDAVVVARGEDARGKRLVAYVVCKEGALLTTTALREFLQPTLPEYMQPTFFVTLENLPLTPNGKVDRRALPTPDMSRPDLKEPFVAPRNLVEEVLAGIWANVLGLGRVGIHDNFFELGGHSLLAIQIAAQVQDTFQIALSLRTFLDAPTVAELTDYLATTSRATGQDIVRITHILMQLDQLSDDEAAEMLDQPNVTVDQRSDN